MEINSQVSPLALNGVIYRSNSRNMERNESCCRIRDQNCISLCVYINLAWNKILRVAVHVFVAIQINHFLYFFLLWTRLNLTSFKSNFKLFLLFFIKFSLMLFAFFNFRLLNFLSVSFATKTTWFYHWSASSTLDKNFFWTFFWFLLIATFFLLFSSSWSFGFLFRCFILRIC